MQSAMGFASRTRWLDEAGLRLAPQRKLASPQGPNPLRSVARSRAGQRNERQASLRWDVGRISACRAPREPTRIERLGSRGHRAHSLRKEHESTLGRKPRFGGAGERSESITYGEAKPTAGSRGGESAPVLTACNATEELLHIPVGRHRDADATQLEAVERWRCPLLSEVRAHGELRKPRPRELRPAEDLRAEAVTNGVRHAQ